MHMNARVKVSQFSLENNAILAASALAEPAGRPIIGIFFTKSLSGLFNNALKASCASPSPLTIIMPLY